MEQAFQEVRQNLVDICQKYGIYQGTTVVVERVPYIPYIPEN